MINEPYRRLWMGYRHLNYYLISDTPRKYITTTLAHASTNSSKRIRFYLKTNISLHFKKKKYRPHKAFSKRFLTSRRIHEHVLTRLALNRSKFPFTTRKSLFDRKVVPPKHFMSWSNPESQRSWLLLCLVNLKSSFDSLNNYPKRKLSNLTL